MNPPQSYSNPQEPHPQSQRGDFNRQADMQQQQQYQQPQHMQHIAQIPHLQMSHQAMQYLPRDQMVHGRNLGQRQHSADRAQQQSGGNRKHPFEMFVGDLSFFCEETHLIDLFQAYGKVVNARIKRPADPAADPRSRSLLYGFVTMDSSQACHRASESLNNSLFMGRQIRIEMSSETSGGKNGRASNPNKSKFPIRYFQVHVSFVSYYANQANRVQPNEEFFRDIFTTIGDLLDVSVKEYMCNEAEQSEEGLALITFSSEGAAKMACQQFAAYEQQGVQIKASLSAKNPSKQSPRDIAHSEVSSFDTDDQHYESSPHSARQGQFSPSDSPTVAMFARAPEQHAMYQQPQESPRNLQYPAQQQPMRRTRTNIQPAAAARSNASPPQTASQYNVGNQQPSHASMQQMAPQYAPYPQAMPYGRPQMYPGEMDHQRGQQQSFPQGAQQPYAAQGGFPTAPNPYMWPHYAVPPHQMMAAYNPALPYMVAAHPQDPNNNNNNTHNNVQQPMMYHAMPPQAMYPYHPSYGMAMNGELLPNNHSVPMPMMSPPSSQMNSEPFHRHHSGNHSPN